VQVLSSAQVLPLVQPPQSTVRLSRVQLSSAVTSPHTLPRAAMREQKAAGVSSLQWSHCQVAELHSVPAPQWPHSVPQPSSPPCLPSHEVGTHAAASGLTWTVASGRSGSGLSPGQPASTRLRPDRQQMAASCLRVVMMTPGVEGSAARYWSRYQP